MKIYKIIRFYSPAQQAKGKANHTVKTGLTLEEAREHCNDPKTRKNGEWFDGYTEDDHGHDHDSRG